MSILTDQFILTRYVCSFPQIKRILKQWHQLTYYMPDELQVQAQASIKAKAFHCIGGAFYMFYPQVNKPVILNAIIALQTISDYLDNLCDRIKVNDMQAFSQLHLSFTDALDPSRPIKDYYRYYPLCESHYLPTLVETCRIQVKQIPYYHEYQYYINILAENYCRLQILKHLTPCGEHQLKQWIRREISDSNANLSWNEWAAATGSTLGIFAFFASGFHKYPEKTKELIFGTYFPWIQGLHILLDYYIDREEDRQHNDLNFTYYYPNLTYAVERLRYLFNESQKHSKHLPYPCFHQLLLEGLISMYGSDPKVSIHKLLESYKTLLNSNSLKSMYHACLLLRKLKHLI